VAEVSVLLRFPEHYSSVILSEIGLRFSAKSNVVEGSLTCLNHLQPRKAFSQSRDRNFPVKSERVSKVKGILRLHFRPLERTKNFAQDDRYRSILKLLKPRYCGGF